MGWPNRLESTASIFYASLIPPVPKKNCINMFPIIDFNYCSIVPMLLYYSFV